VWCYTPEEDILHSHRRENLKSYNVVVSENKENKVFDSFLLSLLARFHSEQVY
jgi:hypothetical protein